MSQPPKRELKEYIAVGHTEAENHFRTQQSQAQLPSHPSDTTRTLTEFLWYNVFGFAYHYLKSRFGKRHPYQSYPQGDDNGIFRMEEKNGLTQLALLSDWASDTPESDAVGAVVASHSPDYSIHLGDIYFVGTPSEVAANFTSPKASWPRGKWGSLALSGNHEMYSNGDAFFKYLLPTMGVREGDSVRIQKAGFFCLENDHWRVIGLDTGYTSVGRPFLEVLSPPDCHFRKEQLSWLREQVQLGNPADQRGIVFLSHHPPFSSFRKSFPEPAKQLSQLLGDAVRPVIWIWGHEHRMVVYHPKQLANLLISGRCIGNGGMPSEIDEPKNNKEAIAFYDQRKRTTLRRIDVGFNGFVWLTFDREHLSMEYRDINDTLVYKEVIRVKEGKLEFLSIK